MQLLPVTTSMGSNKENLFFVPRNPARVNQADFWEKTKKRFCRLSIGEKLAIQYHIQYCKARFDASKECTVLLSTSATYLL